MAPDSLCLRLLAAPPAVSSRRRRSQLAPRPRKEHGHLGPVLFPLLGLAPLLLGRLFQQRDARRLGEQEVLEGGRGEGDPRREEEGGTRAGKGRECAGRGEREAGPEGDFADVAEGLTGDGKPARPPRRA